MFTRESQPQNTFNYISKIFQISDFKYFRKKDFQLCFSVNGTHCSGCGTAYSMTEFQPELQIRASLKPH